MSAHTEKLIRICEQLPENQLAEVEDFAQFLLAKQQDDAWEQAIDSTKPRPKLDQFVRESLAEGSAPLDRDQI